MTIDLYYKVAMNDRLIAALACEPIRKPEWAEVTIPYRDPDGKVYGITCYLLGIPNHHLTLAEIIMLRPYAKLLARCGSRDAQYENVAALYIYGATPEVPGLVEFRRPQDFATRGLYDDAPGWKFRLINYIAIHDFKHGDIPIRAETSYLVNAWVDVPLSDHDMMAEFSAVFSMMSMRGAPDEINPMRPGDCLRQDDFWDTEKLGTAPVRCPEEDW